MPLRLRGPLKTSRLVEAARELACGIVFVLGGDERPWSREEQELVILAQRADFIRREQGPRKMLLAERYAGFVAVDRAASSRSMSNRACSPASSAMPSIARLARASASSSRRRAASAGVPRVKSSARTWARIASTSSMFREIGRATCRDRVCQYVSIWVVAVSIEQK